jgi:hypothetical protein
VLCFVLRMSAVVSVFTVPALGFSTATMKLSAKLHPYW